MGDIFSQDQLHQARLAAAVLPGQGDAVAAADLQAEMLEQGSGLPVSDPDVIQRDKTAAVMLQHVEL